AHLRGTRFHGWRTPATLVEHCRRLVTSGEPLVFAYYDGIDKVAHEYGLRDEFFQAELGAADRLVEALLESLPPSAALVVTSDHGQVHFDAQISLAPIAKLVGAYAGDGRFRFLYAERGAAGALLEEATDRFGSVAWVMGRDQVVDERWLGPAPPSTTVARRLGDVVLAARGPIAFIDPTHPVEAGLRAGHGSLTPAEMFVPLLAGRGSGAG
ncbi:MAG: alkaline phosphatase family protein, partial [Acidimicrobiia bacterium]